MKRSVQLLALIITGVFNHQAWSQTEKPYLSRQMLQYENFKLVEKERNFPVRGMSKIQVTQRYGQPINQTNSVGDPPISSWHYKGFVVFFERDLTITSVAETDILPIMFKDIQ